MSDGDIVDLEIDLGDDWHGLPLDALDPAPERLAAELCPDDPEAAAMLARSLADVRESFLEIDDGRLTAAVHIGFPGTGLVDGALVFGLADLVEVGSPETLETSLLTAESADGAQRYNASTWRERTDPGELVGAHYLLAHPVSTDSAKLEERVVVTVYPPGAAQVVQFVASAQNLSAFDNLPGEIEAMARTLRCRIEEAS